MKNKIAKPRENQEKVRIFTIIGKSMSDILDQFSNVLVREKSTDYEYKKDLRIF